MKGLSSSQEDYLEAILMLAGEGGVTRVSELSRMLEVTPASAAVAVKNLSRAGLVKHESYGYVELTSGGEKLARQLYDRHRIMSSFFQKVLGLDKSLADIEACAIEHSLHQETFEKVVKFFEFMETCKEVEPQFLVNFKEFLDAGGRAGKSCRIDKKSSPVKNLVRLSDLSPGERALVIRLETCGEVRRKLLALGLIRGETIELIRKAPLGDPLEFRIKDYCLSLRKNEADRIFVSREKS
ncbi:MAG: metal-dependent transcriptional regulator [Candidatus Wallbacteria bacterium]|nr:metal-dependent transcriptional regulator [Candidatus Wallbacteria bacterium]